MPIWCPECHAMLPDGTQICPRCGARLNHVESEGQSDFSRSDFFWYSAYTIGIVLIPIIIAVVIGLICVLLFISGRGSHFILYDNYINYIP
jgi:hypothetical protein